MDELILGPEVQIFAHLQEAGQDYVIPPLVQPEKFDGDSFLWVVGVQGQTALWLRTAGRYHVLRGGADAHPV